MTSSMLHHANQLDQVGTHVTMYDGMHMQDQWLSCTDLKLIVTAAGNQAEHIDLVVSHADGLISSIESSNQLSRI